jgi:uncharacterized protein YhbP (UPF0306 family)
LETKIIGKLQGIQFEGKIIVPDNELFTKIKTAYIKRFPFALLTNTKLWLLQLHTIKLIDNRLGFGKKIYWKRELD